MSSKEIVADLIQHFPDDISLEQIAREIDFVAAVRQGLAELDRGESVPITRVADKDYPVVLSRSARRDLQEIVRSLSFDSPERAESLGRFLLSKTKLPGAFTKWGRRVSEFADDTLREIIVRNYRFIYRVQSARGRGILFNGPLLGGGKIR